jgi:hypothetical protein
MAKQEINIGVVANDRKGDSLRAAFQKINANFTELYTALGLDQDDLNLGAFEFSGSTMSTTDSTSITISQAVTVDSDLNVGNELFVRSSRVMSISELKDIVASSTDFADFQARIAAL